MTHVRNRGHFDDCLFLFAASFAAEAVGFWIEPIGLVFASVLALLVILRHGTLQGTLAGTAALLVGTGWAATVDVRMSSLLVLALAFSTAEFVTGVFQAKADNARSNGLATYSVIAASLLLADLALFGGPIQRTLLDPAFNQLPSALEAIWGNFPGSFGHSIVPLVPVLGFVLLAVVRRRPREWTLTLMLGVAAIALYVGIIQQLLEFSARTDPPRIAVSWIERSAMFQNQGEPFSHSTLFYLLARVCPQLLLVLGLSLALLLGPILCPGYTDGVESGVRSGWRSTLALTGVFGLVMGTLLASVTATPQYSSDDLRGRIVALPEHLPQMARPVHGRYGLRSTGMFSLLPETLAQLGMEIRYIGDLTDLTDEHELLILMNPNQRFGNDERLRLERWIEEGGGILALTDHTGNLALRQPLNDIFSQHGIEVNFDTARPDYVSGRLGFEPLVGSPIMGLTGQWRSPTSYGTGASLSVRRPALTILQLKHGTIDRGSFTQIDRGYVTNLSYDPGERRGDIPVGAYVRIGDGRAIIFGDTSTFQNGAASHSREFMSRILLHLLRDGPEPLGHGLLIGLFGLMLASFIGVVIVNSRHWRMEGVAFLTAMTSAWMVISLMLSQNQAPVGPTDARVGIVDLSTMPYTGSGGWAATDFQGLLANMSRDGIVPLVSEIPLTMSLEAHGHGDHLFLLAPSRAFADADEQALDSFLERGGNVVVAAGKEHSAGIAPWLSTHGIAISSAPLGAVPEAVSALPHHLHFYDGWRVDGEGEIIANLRGEPVGRALGIGDGQLVVMGDSKFFWNANLESMDVHRPGNIAFLRQLLSYGAGESGSDEQSKAFETASQRELTVSEEGGSD